MNTADIRNINKSQGLFWAIAVPVTAVIVLVAILLAYHGDKLYDRILQMIHRFAERHSASSHMTLEPQPNGKSFWNTPSRMHHRSWITSKGTRTKR
jgi:hypothetical protein